MTTYFNYLVSKLPNSLNIKYSNGSWTASTDDGSAVHGFGEIIEDALESLGKKLGVIND